MHDASPYGDFEKRLDSISSIHAIACFVYVRKNNDYRNLYMHVFNLITWDYMSLPRLADSLR